MAELKTQKSKQSVTAFINAVEDADQRKDCKVLMRIMKEVTGKRPAMWGPSIVGYGSYHYRYPTGREGDWFLTGFSPRKRNLSIYILAGFDRSPQLMKRLGKFKTGKGCLYVNRLADIDLDVLRVLVADSVEHIGRTHGSGK